MKPRCLAWIVLTIATSSIGCLRAGVTEVRVHDAHAVGVVADSSALPLLAPSGEAKKALVYRGINETAVVERDSNGGIRYESEHWALQTRHDETRLVEGDGRIAPDVLRGSFGPLGGAALVGDQLAREEVRIPIATVNETSAFGTCGDSVTPCRTQPPVPIALTTKKENVAEVTTVRAPLRPFGWLEVPMGVILLGTGSIVGGEELAKGGDSSRATGLAISGGVLVLGGLLLANGLWYLTAPVERTTIYSDGRTR